MRRAGGAERAAATPRTTAMAALDMPFLLSGIPMRGIVFALRDTDPSKLQLLIHTEIGSNYTAPTRFAIAHAVLDKEGRAVDGQVNETRLAPPVNGVPAPLTYVAGARVGQGDYTVKLAVVDGERSGTLELPIGAYLETVGGVRLTELMAGGPAPLGGDLLKPSIGSRAAYGTLQG